MQSRCEFEISNVFAGHTDSTISTFMNYYNIINFFRESQLKAKLEMIKKLTDANEKMRSLVVEYRRTIIIFKDNVLFQCGIFSKNQLESTPESL